MADARRLLPSFLLALLLTWSPARAQEPLPTLPPEEEGATQPPSTPPVTPEAAGTQAPPPAGTPAPVTPPGQPPPGQTPPVAPAPPPVDPDALTFDLKFPA